MLTRARQAWEEAGATHTLSRRSGFAIACRMTATWTAVTVTADRQLAESLESFLLDRGAPGLQTEDVDGAVRITAHFAAAAPLAELTGFVAALRDLFPDAAPPDIAVDTIADSGWAENWKEHFPPLAVGERLFIHPPWVEAVPAERIGIVLDPGMAFGTGHHASTRGCLVLLEHALQVRPGARVLDLGTGSGILAIAAVKLGAGEVWAVDIDAEACAVAVENASVNRVGDAIRIALDLAAVPGSFDIVLANLLAGLLVDFAGAIAARLPPGGIAIGAGLQIAEAPAVRRAWRAAQLEDDGELSEEGWMALAARRAR
jgi:ribosomal protein L11 methyltransferase